MQESIQWKWAPGIFNFNQSKLVQKERVVLFHVWKHKYYGYALNIILTYWKILSISFTLTNGWYCGWWCSLKFNQSSHLVINFYLNASTLVFINIWWCPWWLFLTMMLTLLDCFSSDYKHRSWNTSSWNCDSGYFEGWKTLFLYARVSLESVCHHHRRNDSKRCTAVLV